MTVRCLTFLERDKCPIGRFADGYLRFRPTNRISKMMPVQAALQQLPQQVTLGKLPINLIRMFGTPQSIYNDCFYSARVYHILRKTLKLKQNKYKMATKLLIEEQKRSCALNVRKKNKKLFLQYSKNCFNNLVTVDETWVYYFEPKRKCSNRVWATKHAVRPTIAKR